MNRLKPWVKHGISCLIAFSSALLIVNFGLFFYHRPTGWIDRTNSSTHSIWNPGTIVVQGIEGHGVHAVDENGYLNAGRLIEDGYTLVVGASFTAGKEVSPGKRYTDIMNTCLRGGGQSDELYVYNVAQDGFFFPDIVSCFPALVQEFPNSKNIIIEIGSTDFSADSLAQAQVQWEFDESQTGKNILNNLSLKQKIKFQIKECLPVLSLLKIQVNRLFQDDYRALADEDSERQMENLDAVLALIRSEYDGRLIICYHPNVKITNDGMSVVYEKTTPGFSVLCQKNNIEFVDMSDAFLNAYEEDFSVPYGFNNITIGTGHISRDGHRVIAEELLNVLNIPSYVQEVRK